jgi:predicted transcriptional regulator of viral defense system
MVNGSKIEQLYKTGRSVFTIDDLRVIWQEESPDHLKAQASYYVKKKKIQRLRRGTYALDPYNPLELANKLIVPSYVSLETALLKQGIIFQPADGIMSVARYNKKIVVAGIVFRYIKLPEEVLMNPVGLRKNDGVLMAGPERAVADCLYLGRGIDWQGSSRVDGAEVKKIAGIYPGGLKLNL